MEDLALKLARQKAESETYLKKLLSQISPEAQETFWEYNARREAILDLKLQIVRTI